MFTPSDSQVRAYLAKRARLSTDGWGGARTIPWEQAVEELREIITAGQEEESSIPTRGLWDFE